MVCHPPVPRLHASPLMRACGQDERRFDQAGPADQQHGLKVRLSAAKMVIDINARHPRVLGAAFQGRNLFGHGEGLFEQGFAVRKGEVIDDINEEQGDRDLIRGIAMQIVLLAWYPLSACRERRGVAELRGSVDHMVACFPP